MIEIVLFVALGFLVAALIGLIVAPAIYRRVVKLTERRMRATVPLNAAEIKAAKDMERAAFAAENARMNVELRTEREQRTKVQASTSRLSDTIVKMRSQNEELQVMVSDLKEESGNLKSTLRAEEGKREEIEIALKVAQENNREKEKQIVALIEKANRLSTDVGAHKIDLVSKDTESENLRSTIDALHNEHNKLRKSQARLEERYAELEDDLAEERERADDLDKRLSMTVTKLNNREKTLEAKTAEVERLKEKMSTVRVETADLKKSLRNSETERRALERKLQKFEKQITDFEKQPDVKAKTPKSNAAKPAAKRKPAQKAPTTKKAATRSLTQAEISSRVDKLRTRHNALVENLNKKKTKADDNELRRELAEIAAMMIDLTAAREGANSPLEKILATHKPVKPGSKAKPSLADRAARRIEKTNNPAPN